MLFHTWTFLLFFAIVFPVHGALRGTRAGTAWLLIASYVFYGWWEPYYLILIVYSTALDYWVVAMMDGSRRRKLWLWVSIVNNLGLLGFFKYGGFFTDNMNGLLSLMHVSYEMPPPGSLLPEGWKYLLPVGISFYTFQSMSYTIDFYRGEIPRERSFIRFAAFVSLFPQLVAGPIERASNLLPQLIMPNRITAQRIGDGLSLFVVGLFKKVALADYLALYVDRVYDVPGNHDGATLLLATFAFAWQIYFDFSGYTDMARGVARAMGFDLMLNFNNPYLATGIGDFWRRWHISLSTWFRDYVYVPLGGNRNGPVRTYVNVFITMVVSGLWHGAGWNFVIWGALHALGSLITRELERSPFYKKRVPDFVKRTWVFLFVLFAWIFFRAQSTGDAWVIITRIATAGVGDPRFPLVLLAIVGVIWLYEFFYESRWKTLVQLRPVRVGLVVAMVFYLALCSTAGEQAFIYFQF